MTESVRTAWTARLDVREIDIDANIFEIGGTSRAIADVRAGLNAELDRDIPLVAFYQNQTIRALVRYLVHGDAAPGAVPARVRRAGGSRRQRELRTAARAARTEG
ncbi:acyl carrier protein [Actinomadura fibrosa]|uniref:Acyl carrier protein n=1 Tax=Actinomadura fibrosa TaxID=111802 RepID=A0ABW2XLZ7_9ACTN|nr:acyl carrier protein [Actinomadura fibrosa]